VSRHGQQDDTGGSNTNAYADKVRCTSAKVPTKWHPKHCRDGTDKSIDNLTETDTAQGNWRNRSSLHATHTHLASNQIAIGYAHVRSIDDADLGKAHHAVLKNEACCRKF